MKFLMYDRPRGVLSDNRNGACPFHYQHLYGIGIPFEIATYIFGKGTWIIIRGHIELEKRQLLPLLVTAAVTASFTMVVVVDNRSWRQSGLPRELFPAEVVTLRTVTHSPAGLGLGP